MELSASTKEEGHYPTPDRDEHSQLNIKLHKPISLLWALLSMVGKMVLFACFIEILRICACEMLNAVILE